MFLYRDVLKKSLAITWHHKYLWFFGLFAAVLSGVGSYDLPTGQGPDSWFSPFYNGFYSFFHQGITGGGIFDALATAFKDNPLATFAFLVFSVVLLILTVFLLWLTIVSEVGLINNSAKIISSNGKKEKTTIGEGVEVGIKNFWPVLGYNLITSIVITFLLFLVSLPLIFVVPGSSIKIAWLYSLLFFVFIPLSLVIYFICKYAICFKVLKGKSFVDSIVDALKLFGKNWIISLEMAIILFLIDILFILAIVLAIKILAIPYLFLVSIVAAILPIIVSQVVLALGLIVALLFVVLAGSILMTFKLTAWTDVFINLVDKKGALPKVVRVTNVFKK
jgi:hypothetical protein